MQFGHGFLNIVSWLNPIKPDLYFGGKQDSCNRRDCIAALLYKHPGPISHTSSHGTEFHTGSPKQKTTNGMKSGVTALEATQ